MVSVVNESNEKKQLEGVVLVSCGCVFSWSYPLLSLPLQPHSEGGGIQKALSGPMAFGANSPATPSKKLLLMPQSKYLHFLYRRLSGGAQNIGLQQIPRTNDCDLVWKESLLV